MGRLGDTSRPRAVAQGTALSSTVGDLSDPCAALRVTLQIEPGEEKELVFGLGEAADANALTRLAKQYSSPATVAQALQKVKCFWSDFVGRVKIQTPSPAIDLMVNGWLPYQNLSCRIWGRSSFYQGGGAFGFRDQLQDAAALVYHDPQLTRQQILTARGTPVCRGGCSSLVASRLGTRFAHPFLGRSALATHLNVGLRQNDG